MKRLLESYQFKIDDMNYYLFYKTLEYKNSIISTCNHFDDTIYFGKCDSMREYFYNYLMVNDSINYYDSYCESIKIKIEITFTYEEI